MLMRSPTDPTADLDATRRRVDRAAGAAALAADRHFLRLCGMALVRAAEVNGADFEVARLNDRLRAAGRSDILLTATARLRSPIDGRVVDSLASALMTEAARARR
jgi:hypothetical protein